MIVCSAETMDSASDTCDALLIEEGESRQAPKGITQRAAAVSVLGTALAVVVVLACSRQAIGARPGLAQLGATALLDAEDPHQAEADRMIQQNQGIIKALDMTILQCDEGIRWLDDQLDAGQQPYVVNAMLTFVGERAASCNLNKEGLAVHQHLPTEHQDVCVFHCGESWCGASLTYMTNSQANIKSKCGKVVYLQAGALCFVEKVQPLQDIEKCSGIVQPHKPGELAAFARDVGAQFVPCDKVEEELSTWKGGEESYYIWNTMSPVFGSAGGACDLEHAHAAAPTSAHDVCVLYCGEADCPMALKQMEAEKEALTGHCGKVVLLSGGAKCFLEKGIPVKEENACRSLVAPAA